MKTILDTLDWAIDECNKMLEKNNKLIAETQDIIDAGKSEEELSRPESRQYIDEDDPYPRPLPDPPDRGKDD